MFSQCFETDRDAHNGNGNEAEVLREVAELIREGVLVDTTELLMERHYTAMKIVKELTVKERFALLASVVAPSTEVLAAQIAQRGEEEAA